MIRKLNKDVGAPRIAHPGLAPWARCSPFPGVRCAEGIGSGMMINGRSFEPPNNAVAHVGECVLKRPRRLNGRCSPDVRVAEASRSRRVAACVTLMALARVSMGSSQLNFLSSHPLWSQTNDVSASIEPQDSRRAGPAATARS